MAMTLVSTTTVGSGGAASIEFTNIPQTGKDLLLLVSGRTDSLNQSILFTVNNDSGSNYVYRTLRVDNTSVSSGSATFTALFFPQSSSDYTANTFGNGQLYLSNYAGTTSKSISIDSSAENNGTSNQQLLVAGQYTQTTAISSVKLVVTQSGNFVQHSTASLYIIS